MKKLLFFLLVLFALPAFAQDQKPEPKDGEMKLYYFVLLKKGPDRSHDAETAKKIQEGHMAHITKMAEEGKLTIAGPFGDDGDWRGIFIFTTKSIEETKALVEQDPAVKSGRLSYEIRPWWSQKGAKLN